MGHEGHIGNGMALGKIKKARRGRCCVGPRLLVGIRGHPIHPMLIPFPVAFFVATLVCDVRSDGGSSWKAGSSVGRSLSPLYVAVRLVLRHYFPPDTPRLRSFLGVVPLLPGGISRREYAVVYLAGLSN
jgi:hypothetical protein